MWTILHALNSITQRQSLPKSMQRISSVIFPSLHALQVYGANTDVGKTIVSTILCKALRERRQCSVGYLKPVSTGSIEDVDELCGPAIFLCNSPGSISY